MGVYNTRTDVVALINMGDIQELFPFNFSNQLITFSVRAR